MTRSETFSRLPAVNGAERPDAQAGSRPRRGTANAPYAAQSLGQEGVRRGLRGGAPVLTAARSAYLTAEWSGPGDRRAAPGAIRRTTA